MSSCISANCIQDTHDFSEVLSNSNEIDNTLILDTSIIDVSSDEKKENTPLDVERFRAKITACETLLDESSNSETGSQQSVLSTISPTKDRTISKRSHKNDDDSKMDLIDELNLKNFYRSGESAGTGDKIYGLVASGQKQDLISYAKLNDIDLRTVLFEVYDHFTQFSLYFYALLTSFKTYNLQERWHTCLHVAVVHNQLSMVNYLVDVGVDINAKDKVNPTNMFTIIFLYLTSKTTLCSERLYCIGTGIRTVFARHHQRAHQYKGPRIFRQSLLSLRAFNRQRHTQHAQRLWSASPATRPILSKCVVRSCGRRQRSEHRHSIWGLEYTAQSNDVEQQCPLRRSTAAGAEADGKLPLPD